MGSSLFDPAPGVVGKDHPDTSYEAADLVTPRTGTQRREVLDLLISRGSHGATDLEIQEALSMEGNTERPRRGELVKAGLVVDSKQRRVQLDRARIVWVYSPALPKRVRTIKRRARV